MPATRMADRIAVDAKADIGGASGLSRAGCPGRVERGLRAPAKLSGDDGDRRGIGRHDLVEVDQRPGEVERLVAAERQVARSGLHDDARRVVPLLADAVPFEEVAVGSAGDML